MDWSKERRTSLITVEMTQLPVNETHCYIVTVGFSLSRAVNIVVYG
ncbi:MAG: hypothetical protein ACI8VC_002357 [Candidatus Endobugula sp.]|jgi:hypothetical protein